MKVAESILSEIVRRIVEHAHPERIILFGSQVSGAAGPDSDLDFLIVKKLENPGARRFLGIRRYLRGFKIPMDVLVYTPEEIARWKDVEGSVVHQALRTGRLLYG